MWEVDPETRSKLLALQKRPGNDRCCDCPAMSPQWASPKFGTFICLECAGQHRGLGVHISFVRSITMDAFKGGEIARMDLGGNTAWRTFWEDKQQERGDEGRRWEDVSLEERYGDDVGEEWKERLTCRAEGREFTGVSIPLKRAEATRAPFAASPMHTPSLASKQKERNEDFFRRMGGENANRPADLPPSKGGKYAGFGSQPAAFNSSKGNGAEETAALPGVDEFQKDPVAALTKGFGWFTSTVGKGAKTVNDGWIQPTAQKIAQSDLQTQARLTATSLAQNIQTGTKGAAEQFSKFIEGGPTIGSPRAGPGGASRNVVEPERRDFWDSFGEDKGPGISSTGKGRGSAIGTVAVKTGGAGGATRTGAKDDEWDEW